MATEPAPKKKILPNRGELKRLARLAESEKYSIATAVGLLLFSTSVTLSVPMGIKYIIDIIAENKDALSQQENLYAIATVLGSVFVLGAMANAGRVFLIQRSGQRIIAALRQRVFAHVIRLEMAFFDKAKTGELINRLASDTEVVGKAITDNVSNGLRAAGQGVVAVSLMVFISPPLAAVSLLVVPPIGVAMVIYGRMIKRIAAQTQDALAAATSSADETVGNVRSVRAFAWEEKMAARYAGKVDDALELAVEEAAARAGFFGFAGLTGNLGLLTVLAYGGSLAATGAVTIGDLSAFAVYTAYVGVAVNGLASFHADMMKGVGASHRVFDLLDMTAEVTDGDIIPDADLQGKIEFRGVDFQFPARDATVLKALDLAIPAGSVQAIVGGSGSGKSTLAALLLRLYDINNGAVLLDGRDIRELDTLWLRSRIGIVEQRPALFSGSVLENIRLGRPDASFEDVVGAASQANADTFISAFPDGYDTAVGERGVTLSGGQVQRIAIARAILKDPKILILDEATSALDSESEHIVQEALDRLMVGRTTIQIAHRLSTIAKSTSIAVIEGGRIAESGSYGELMDHSGRFHEFVQRQKLTDTTGTPKDA